MSVVRRALAVLPATALAVMVPSAHAAVIQTLPCIPYIAGVQTMPVGASGFAPNDFVQVSTNTTANATPRILTSLRLDAAGAAKALTSPPPFTKTNGNLETFNLIAVDSTNPAAPVVATSTFQVVRFGLTRSPSPKKPSSRVTVTARGFAVGKPIYAHFRFGGITRRTVSLGVAQGPCGIAEKKMRALPTKTRYGAWKAYIDQSKTFSVNTRPQWIDSFRIYRTVS